MYIFLIVMHVIAALILIASILLQAGRGGGLSEMFGGSSTQTIFGTGAATFLKRATTVSAIVFLVTSLTLAIYSSRRSKSIMERVRIAPVQEEQLPLQETATPESTVPVEQDETAETQ